MRRVITGEQVAQIYNPDPFARPVFRAPVYQTPAGIILLAWLARLLYRLARLAVRHPVTTVTLALLAFLWFTITWIGLIAIIACAILILATWRYFWPSGFCPVGDCPGAEHVAGADVPAPLARGDDHRRPGPVLPGPDHPAGAG